MGAAVSRVKIKDVFLNKLLGISYYLDFYQRPYTWSEAVVKLVFGEVLEAFHQVYDPSDSPEKRAKYRGSFRDEVMIFKDHKKQNWIVDGQQRLRTFTLALIVLINLIEDANQRAMLAKYVVTTLPNGRLIPLINDPATNEYMLAILNGEKYKGKGFSQSVSNLQKNFAVMQELISADWSQDKLVAFAHWMLNRVQFGRKTPTDARDVAFLFISMNSKVDGLRQYEIVKALIMNSIKSNEQKRHIEKAWQKIIDKMLTSFTENDLDEFFRDFFRAKFATRVGTKKDSDFDYMSDSYGLWFKEFRYAMGYNNESDYSRLVISELTQAFHVYLMIENARKDCTAGLENVFYAGKSEAGYLFPMLLSSITPKDSKSLIERKLNAVAHGYERLFITLRVNGEKTSSDTMRVHVMRLVKAIRNKNLADIYTAFQNEYVSIVKAETFENVSPRLGELSFNTSRFILSRVTQEFETIAGNGFISWLWNGVGNNAPTVEHCISDDYQVGGKLSNLFRDAQEHSIYRNMLGAMGMVKKTTNSSMGASLLSVKVLTYRGENIWLGSLSPESYDANGKFRNNPSLNAFLAKNTQIVLNPYDNFNTEAIAERTQTLVEMLKLIYSNEVFLTLVNDENEADAVKENYLESTLDVSIAEIEAGTGESELSTTE